MKIRIRFAEQVQGSLPERVVQMAVPPRVGEILVSGTHGACKVLNVLHTPDDENQDAILELALPES